MDESRENQSCISINLLIAIAIPYFLFLAKKNYITLTLFVCSFDAVRDTILADILTATTVSWRMCEVNVVVFCVSRIHSTHKTTHSTHSRMVYGTDTFHDRS